MKNGVKNVQVMAYNGVGTVLNAQANLSETSPFLFAQMAVLSSFLQVLIVLGMSNFVLSISFFQLPPVEWQYILC